MILPQVSPLGDSALTVTWPDGIREETRAWVRWVQEQVKASLKVQDLVPSYATLSIFYEPDRIDYQTISREVEGILRRGPPLGDHRPEGSREFRIPVVYDGPDLGEVAQRAGLTATDVIARHSDRWYEVGVVGFAPGWAYLGDLDPALALPRRPAPRPRVPAGSVAIANAQTGVYPFAMPGGWHLIGRTETVMFDPSRAQPALLRVGDRVRFEPQAT